MKDCHPVDQDKVQARLEAWYKEDGREDGDHPMHCLYTGLAAKYASQEAE